MGLRIQNNIAAMFAHRNLQASDTALTKSLERLSSGYRINRAADDAAGLAISEAFRADIASMNMASRNASEANALLQVAEGAGDQISNMLVRLKELATQASSANATAQAEKIDAEKEKLLAEIDKIVNSTEYADTKLLDGSYGVAVLSTGADIIEANGYESISGMKAGYSYTIAVVDTAGSAADITITAYSDQAGTTAVAAQTVYDVAIPDTGSTSTVEFSALGVTLGINENISEAVDGDTTDSLIVASNAGSSTFQLGAEADGYNQIDISLGNLTASSLGIASISFTTVGDAQTAMGLIDTAISNLNTVRGDIGAAANQLMYHAANLASTIENMQAAESVIRDVDMAAEMTDFTKNQILMQAGTAMLAQANMVPQMVLSLFG
jgi:flagellin